MHAKTSQKFEKILTAVPCSCLEFLEPKLLFTVSQVHMLHAWKGRFMHASCMLHAWRGETHSCIMHAWMEEPCMFHGWNGRHVHVSCMYHARYMHLCMRYVETCMFHVQNFQQGGVSDHIEKLHVTIPHVCWYRARLPDSHPANCKICTTFAQLA